MVGIIVHIRADIFETITLLDQTSEHITLMRTICLGIALHELGKSNIIQIIYLAFYSRWKRSCHFTENT